MKLHSAKEKAGVKKKDKKQTQGDDDAWARVMGYAAELESPEPPSSPEPEPAQSKRNVEISAKDRDHLIQQFRCLPKMLALARFALVPPPTHRPLLPLAATLPPLSEFGLGNRIYPFPQYRAAISKPFLFLTSHASQSLGKRQESCSCEDGEA